MPTGARTITRVRRPRADKLSPTPSSPTYELIILRTIILPRESYEEGRGWVTHEGWDIFIMPTSRVITDLGARAYADGDIVHSDRIRIDGVEWQVDGPPAPYDKGSIRKATRVRVSRVGA